MSSVKRWSINYITQRDITRDISIDLSWCNLQVQTLRKTVAERDTSLLAANAATEKYKVGFNKDHDALAECLHDTRRMKTWAWIGKGTALVVVVIAIVKGVMYLTRPLS